MFKIQARKTRQNACHRIMRFNTWLVESVANDSAANGVLWLAIFELPQASSLTLQAPISTYKFSKLISIHFL